MGNVLRIDIVADGRKAESTFDRVGGRAGKLGKALAVGIAGGVAAVGVGAAALAVSSVKAASDVEQAFGATESVFGRYAGSVQKAAKGAASSVGLAQSEYAGLANVLGAQLKNMGTSASQLAPKTDALIKQGADLAATFGGSTADAVSAVSSLLKGERDPIERYGVSIKAADVAARLQAQGLDKLKGPALAAAQAQATLALLTQQTSSAQGAFGRESETAAGQQQRLTAQWTNAKAELGAGLLPIVTRFATYLSTTALPFVMRLASGFKAQLGPSISAAGPIVSRIGGFITGTLVPAGQRLYAWFVEKIAPGIRGYVTPVLAGLRSAFASVQAAVERNRPQLEKIGTVLRTLAEFIAQKVAPVVGKVLGEAFKLVGKALGVFIDGIGHAVDGISGLVGWIRDAVEWVDKLAGKLKGGVGAALEKLPGFGLLSMGVTVTPTSSPAPAGFAGLTGGAAPLASSSSSSSSGLPDFLAVAPSFTETHVHLHVDGAFVGNEVDLARQLRRVFNAEADRFGWATA